MISSALTEAKLYTTAWSHGLPIVFKDNKDWKKQIKSNIRTGYYECQVRLRKKYYWEHKEEILKKRRNAYIFSLKNMLK